MSNLESLPNELIQLILKFVRPVDLHACTLINQQFHGAANPHLWRCPLHVKDQTSFNKVMTGLVESDSLLGEHMRHAYFASFLTDTQLLDFMKYARHLETLTIWDAQHITDTIFQHLPSYCPKIKNLSLHGNYVITQHSVLTLTQHCNQLCELELTLYPGVLRDAFLALVACPLKCLTISIAKTKKKDDGVNSGSNNNDDDNDDDTIMDKTATLDLTGFQHLWSFTIIDSPSRFTQRIMTALTQHPDCLPQLTEFWLDGCDTLTEQQAIVFMKSRPGISSLTLNNTSFTDAYLEAIASSLHRISGVGLSFGTGFTAQGVRRLILACPLLNWVDLDGCEFTTQDFPEADDEDGIFLEYLDDYTISEIRHDRDSEDGEWFYEDYYGFEDDFEGTDYDDDDSYFDPGDYDHEVDWEMEERLARWDFMDRWARGEIQFSDEDDE